MGMMYGNGSFKGGIDAAVLAYIGDSTLTTSADNLGDAINEHEEDITDIKSNLTDKASRNLTWKFSSPFSLSAEYDASSFWDEMNEIIIMVANNNTGTNASYYPIHYYKEMDTMTVVNGYGLGGNTFCQINFNSVTKKITMLDCRNGGTQYSPFVKFYYK